LRREWFRGLEAGSDDFYSEIDFENNDNRDFLPKRFN